MPKKPKPDPVNPEAVKRALAFIPSRLYKEGETMIVKSAVTDLELFEGVQPPMLTIQYPEPPFTTAWVCSVWVPWRYRRRQLASVMLQAACERIHARGFDAALAALPYGEKAPTQAALVRFYEGLGFERVHEFMLVNRRPRA